METRDYDLCIIGAGLSGLALTTFLAHSRPELRLLLLEKDAQAGGLIKSHSQDGYLAERGPHGFLDNCPESQELIRLAGLEAQAVYAPLSRFSRYLCLDGRLKQIPQTPWKVIRAPLMPLKDKLRVLGDLWRPFLEGEPSVAQWVDYRFGSALLPFADAALTGTYAGDIERLSIDALMPGIRALEREHGSVIRGLFQRMRQRRKVNREQQRTSKASMPSMTSFTEGMEMLPRALAKKIAIKELLCLENPVHSLSRDADGWRVQSRKAEIRCKNVALTLPIWQSLTLLRPLCPDLPPPEIEVPESRLATVVLGFDERARIPFGFGYLAPEQEKRFALGALFSSHMFADRAPKDRHLLEAPVGGRRHPEHIEMDDNELIARTYQDLQQLMPLPSPCFSAVLRPQSGIPQFEAGYLRLCAWREQLEGRMPGLHLCGFGWNGIGVNDMVKAAARLAANIGEQNDNTGKPVEKEIKPVYF